MIDLSIVFNDVGASLEIEKTIDLSSEIVFHQKIFDEPITISGFVKNNSGIVSLQYTATGLLDLQCDRCLKPISRKIDSKYVHLLIEKFQNSDNERSIDNFIVCKNKILDLSELSMTDILLNLDTKVLCNDDCKGLCNTCGQDLNEKKCDCNSKVIDPRLAKLQDLLK